MVAGQSHQGLVPTPGGTNVIEGCEPVKSLALRILGKVDLFIPCGGAIVHVANVFLFDAMPLTVFVYLVYHNGTCRDGC